MSELLERVRGVRELPIYGGQSYERQLRGLSAGAQIIIGTPGRIMDHLERRTLKLDQLRTVILDEADRMLDMGFVDDIRTVLKHAPAERQTVFFSATLPRPIQELIKQFTKHPTHLRMETPTLDVPAIEQIYYEVDRRSKLEVLCRLIDLEDIRFGLVFCATKLMVDELTEHLLARGYAADKLHGDMTQAMRERAMARFRRRGTEFLVATDVAARGLDVDDIEVVFNYDLPHDGEDYVHRIGRTGRAGRSGRAITFVAGREIYKLQNIMRFTRGRIRRARVPSADEVEEKRTNDFFETLRETLEKGEYPQQETLLDRLLEQGHAATDIASALIHLLNQSGGEKPGRPAERKAEPRVPLSQKETAGADATGQARHAATPRARPENEVNSDRVSHEPGMVRLALDVGREHDIRAGDVVGVILGATRIPKECVGAIRMRDRETLVDVAEEHADTVLKKLHGIRFKGRKLTARLAG